MFNPKGTSSSKSIARSSNLSPRINTRLTKQTVTRMNATRTSGHKCAAVLGKRTTWLGLVRDRTEIDGLPVREMPTGGIDGGTWWLKLKKP